MALLNLSAEKAQVGQPITHTLWNNLLSKLLALLNGGLNSANHAAAGLNNASLASPNHTIVQETKIVSPGKDTAAGAGLWWDAVLNDITLGTYYDGMYLGDLTRFVVPCAGTIDTVWQQTMNAVPQGQVKLYKNGAAIAGTEMNCSTAGSTTSGLAVAVAAGDVLSWRGRGIPSTFNLPIVVGFSAKAANRS